MFNLGTFLLLGQSGLGFYEMVSALLSLVKKQNTNSPQQVGLRFLLVFLLLKQLHMR